MYIALEKSSSNFLMGHFNYIYFSYVNFGLT